MDGIIEMRYSWWNGDIFSIPIPDEDKKRLFNIAEELIPREYVMGKNSGAMHKKINENVYHGLWSIHHKRR